VGIEHTEIDALARLEQIAAESGDGGMDHKEWKSAREKAKAQQS
jgi:hypothetical protein